MSVTSMIKEKYNSKDEFLSSIRGSVDQSNQLNQEFVEKIADSIDNQNSVNKPMTSSDDQKKEQ